uniref:Calpain catalytic domain-containing protein n=1 Tax=Gouania willdenowi TaxID=441366 RepID=A0A8C5DHJ1_GOUWI
MRPWAVSKNGDEGSASNPAKFKSQDFAQLKENCIRKRRLFVDYSFPPNDRSLGDVGLSSWQEVEWLRPKEPNFCSKGASRFDYSQGSLGNCWFLAAIGSLTIQKNLLAQVVPMDQSFNNYAGIFHFRFWYFGKWVDVVIDDKLPTMNKQLLFVHNKSGNEFWVPLMEKAYAKLCGTYADLNAGSSAEACKDFSGGVTMAYELRDAHKSGHEKVLWERLTRATGCKSMICCGTFNKERVSKKCIANTGLVNGHAYAVTGVTEVRYYGSEVKLVRLLNPWGKQEWNGDWSDKSDKWDRVSPDDREKCFNREDGEFWMEMEDFCHNFQVLWMCCENPNFLDGDLTVQWKCMTYDGSWIAGRSAGGNVNERTFSTNPQYRIDIDVIDKTEKQDMNILISLMQKPEQDNRKERRVFPTAITIYKVQLRKLRPLNKQTYGNQRDLIDQYSLEPGEYLLIPSTMEPYQDAENRLFLFFFFWGRKSKIGFRALMCTHP